MKPDTCGYAIVCSSTCVLCLYSSTSRFFFSIVFICHLDCHPLPLLRSWELGAFVFKVAQHILNNVRW